MLGRSIDGAATWTIGFYTKTFADFFHLERAVRPETALAAMSR